MYNIYRLYIETMKGIHMTTPQPTLDEIFNLVTKQSADTWNGAHTRHVQINKIDDNSYEINNHNSDYNKTDTLAGVTREGLTEVLNHAQKFFNQKNGNHFIVQVLRTLEGP